MLRHCRLIRIIGCERMANSPRHNLVSADSKKSEGRLVLSIAKTRLQLAANTASTALQSTSEEVIGFLAELSLCLGRIECSIWLCS
jgi:hypothetical protein